MMVTWYWVALQQQHSLSLLDHVSQIEMTQTQAVELRAQNNTRNIPGNTKTVLDNCQVRTYTKTLPQIETAVTGLMKTLAALPVCILLLQCIAFDYLLHNMSEFLLLYVWKFLAMANAGVQPRVHSVKDMMLSQKLHPQTCIPHLCTTALNHQRIFVLQKYLFLSTYMIQYYSHRFMVIVWEIISWNQR